MFRHEPMEKTLSTPTFEQVLMNIDLLRDFFTPFVSIDTATVMMDSFPRGLSFGFLIRPATTSAGVDGRPPA